MSTWTPDQLQTLADRDDFHISPYREDGQTPGTPTWIWSVIVDDQVYVRAYNGTASRWYQAAMAQRAGIIRSGPLETEVSFAPAADEITDKVDEAYRDKYADSPYLTAMTSPRTRAATVKVLPRGGTATGPSSGEAGGR